MLKDFLSKGAVQSEKERSDCYDEEIIPTIFTSVEKTVKVRPAYKRIIAIPAEYETVTERVLAKPEHYQGAEFDTITERVLVVSESKRLIPIPAEFEEIEEEYLFKEESFLNEEKWKTVIRFELLNSSYVREEIIPAQYGTITKLVVYEEGTGDFQPAEYKTITKKVLRTPPTTREEVIPAEYKTVETFLVARDGKIKRVKVPCD